MTGKKVKTAKQTESRNFHHAAACLSLKGYDCVRLADDWNGADFFALHDDGKKILRVQLKSRLTIAKKYAGKNLFIMFPLKDQGWCLVKHDKLVALVGKKTEYLKSSSWEKRGYHTVKPNASLCLALRPYCHP